MAISSAQVSVTTTATALNSVDPDNWLRVKVHVPSAGTEVFIGDSGVTSANGYSVVADARVEFEIPPRAVLYAVTDAGSSTVHVFRV